MSGLGSSRQEVKSEAVFALARGLMFDSDDKCFYEPINAYGSIYNSLLISSYDKGVKKRSMEAANLWLGGLSERVSNDLSPFLSCFQGQGQEWAPGCGLAGASRQGKGSSLFSGHHHTHMLAAIASRKKLQ